MPNAELFAINPNRVMISKCISNVQPALFYNLGNSKPSKSRNLSIVKGKVVDEKFAINEEVMPTVLEKPVKSLGRWYDASLSDKSQDKN